MKFFSKKTKDKVKPKGGSEGLRPGEPRDLSLVLDLMGVGFLVLDKKDRISEVNQSCMKFLEISATAIGSPGVEVLKAHALVQLFREVKKEGSLVDEINGPISGGLSFLVSLTYDPERQETLIVLLDTTRLHKLESVRRDFISNLSHELRTPVSVIRANSEALIDGALEDHDAAKKFSKAILKNSEKLTYLLSDILNLATIESGEYSLDIQDMNPKNLIEEIVKNISEQFSLVSIKVDVDDKLLVKMDPQAFEQVLTNLLENAAKYSSKDIENVVKIRSRKIGSLVRFEVEDNGIGISPEDRERVFERFFRAQNKNTLSTSGTGLGLSIVKNLVNLMGGSVGNEQAHPEGTIFWFSLNSSN